MKIRVEHGNVRLGPVKNRQIFRSKPPDRLMLGKGNPAAVQGTDERMKTDGEFFVMPFGRRQSGSYDDTDSKLLVDLSFKAGRRTLIWLDFAARKFPFEWQTHGLTALSR